SRRAAGDRGPRSGGRAPRPGGAGRSRGVAGARSGRDVRDRSDRLRGVGPRRYRARGGGGCGGSRAPGSAPLAWRGAGAAGIGQGSAAGGAQDRGGRARRAVRAGGVAVLSVEVLTLFPRLIAAPLEESILGKAREKGLLRVQVTDIRDFADGKHRVTDDVPYGGGAGMVMKPEPLVAAIEAARERLPGARVILMSPQGSPFDQAKARELAQASAAILVCGRYEGVD